MTISPISAEATDFPPRVIRRLWWGAALFFVLGLMLFLFVRGIIRIDEGRYAETAREMIAEGGTAWEMRLMGVRYYEKPPMTYWLSAASMNVLGVGAAASRVPLLISILVTLSLCAVWTRRQWGKVAAKWGTIVLGASLGMVIGMSILLTDPLLVMFFTATCFLLFETYRSDGTGRRWPWLLAAAGAALGGVLTKGFVAIVLPGAILVAWLLWERRLRDLWRWSLLPVGIAFLGTLALVLWQIEIHNPGFNFQFIIQEHLQRFTGTRAIQGHPEPFWYYLPVLIAFAFPWSFFTLRAIRGMRTHQDLKGDSFSRFLLMWAGIVFLFFSVSSGKLMSYILPMMPPVLLLLARRGVLPARVDSDVKDRRQWNLGAFLPMLAPVGIAVFCVLARTQWVRMKMGPPTWISLLPAGILLLIWGWVLLRGYWKTLPGLLLVVAGGYLSFAFLTTSLAGPGFLAGLKIHDEFYQEVENVVGPEDVLVLCHQYDPAVAFSLERIPWMYFIRNELGSGMDMEPNLPNIYQDPKPLYLTMELEPDRTYYAVASLHHRERMEEAGIRFAPEPVVQDQALGLFEFLPPHKDLFGG